MLKWLVMLPLLQVVQTNRVKVVLPRKYLPETPFILSEESFKMESLKNSSKNSFRKISKKTSNRISAIINPLSGLKKSGSTFKGYRTEKKEATRQSRTWSDYRVWSVNNIQHLFFVQKTLAGKSYYEVVHQKPNQGEYFDFSFYSHPREGYNKKMYVCKSEGYIKLWSVLLNECSADKNWSLVYTAYVSTEYREDTTAAFVAGNNGKGMPYSTRLSTKKPCCKQKDSLVSFSPCCHYKWFPKKFYMPTKDDWDTWSEWSQCSNSCGTGQRYRRRKCTNPPCMGESTEVSECDLDPCPNPVWSNWSTWSECSRSCGYSQRHSTRYCISGDCQGESLKRDECVLSACPGKQIWSDWTNWTNCPENCKIKAMSYRTRTCSGTQCTNDNMKQAKKCPICESSSWKMWSSWSDCNVKCGTGYKRRSRECSGNYCTGNATDSAVCNMPPCKRLTLGDKQNRSSSRPNMLKDVINPRQEFGKEELQEAVSEFDGTFTWSSWGPWEPCTKTCGTGLTWRKKQCSIGACKKNPMGAREVKTCQTKYCHGWGEWSDWTACSRTCGGGMKARTRNCPDGVAGHGGCIGLKYGRSECHLEDCVKKYDDEEFVSSESNGPIPYNPTPYSLNYFEQSCIDYHNFFRSIHNIEPLLWNPELQVSAQKWADYLAVAAPEHPLKILPGFEKSDYWPHSNADSIFRKRGVGENIAWDFSEKGSPCSESVYRWYSEYFYFDQNNPMQSRRGAEPVGHLTQLLWTATEAVGCAVAHVWVPNKPGYAGEGMTSSYTVCHYSPQGNIIGLEKQNLQPKKPDLCATYDVNTGRSDCGEAGSCMGLSKSSTCGCGYAAGNKLPRCTGHCIVQCWNVWGSRNFWPQECMGESMCTCNKDGAFCK